MQTSPGRRIPQHTASDGKCLQVDTTASTSSPIKPSTLDSKEIYMTLVKMNWYKLSNSLHLYSAMLCVHCIIYTHTPSVYLQFAQYMCLKAATIHVKDHTQKECVLIKLYLYKIVMNTACANGIHCIIECDQCLIFIFLCIPNNQIIIQC